ncbi:hypothetical protein V6N11_012360 [Hibiscus sabdariffa]|uniref:Glycosyl transferase CAP10 domain-containing protein n=1 Tax=Hibiscus sabdariffa TaxID=183260 RepID=A0ABR2QB18_9ROSI
MLGIQKKYHIRQESIHGRTKDHQTSFCLISLSELHKPFTDTPWRPLKKAAASSFAAVLLIAGVLVYVGWLDTSIFSGVSSFQNIVIGSNSTTPTQKPEFPLECSTNNQTQTCPRDYPATSPDMNTWNLTCPSFFRWIHEDLRYWKQTGITQDMIERARRTAHFRLVIVNGMAYVEKYRNSIQTRDKFTLWGILQLLRLYPGRLPDLELMFNCDDRPVVGSRDYQGPDARPPPPLFRYCADEWSMDIVFPDWSFWGWAETNIRPWGNLLEEMKKGNQRTQWKERVPYAYWRGNPSVVPTRNDLMKCNVTDQNKWIQDWELQSKQGFKQSNLEDQCTHRGMVPLQHYWPIRPNSICKSLKFAVQWGNLHPHKAQAIGEAASNFIQEDLKMDNVYNYMFHLLNEYAKLLKFKPAIPLTAVELCSETMACQETGTWRKFMVESLVMSPSNAIPCAMPPPYEPYQLREFLERKANSTRQVEMWEDQYWHTSDKKQ